MNPKHRCVAEHGLHHCSFLFPLLVATVLASTVTAQENKKGCGKSLKIVSQSKLPEADEKMARRLHDNGEGKGVITVSEGGEVTQVKVVSASPREAADLSSDLAKSMKFAARPGCEDFGIETYFRNLH